MKGRDTLKRIESDKTARGAGEPFVALNDEALVSLARAGDARAQDFLLERYKNFVKRHAHAYFLAGADREDIIQEGMIGLYKAVRDYDSRKSDRFEAFARLCVTRQMIAAIKSASRKKHGPLNTYISLSGSREPEAASAGADIADIAKINMQLNPEDLFIDKEGRMFIEACIAEKLSAMENRVLSLFMQGKTYGEISLLTSKDIKSVDNSLQRVRRKLGRLIFSD